MIKHVNDDALDALTQIFKAGQAHVRKVNSATQEDRDFIERQIVKAQKLLNDLEGAVITNASKGRYE